MSKKITYLEKIIWIFANIIEWLSIPLFIAAMGFNINIEIYETIKNWKYIKNLFYILIVIAIVIYLYFSFRFSKLKLKREKSISQISCIIMLLLLIIKAKL